MTAKSSNFFFLRWSLLSYCVKRSSVLSPGPHRVGGSVCDSIPFVGFKTIVLLRRGTQDTFALCAPRIAEGPPPGSPSRRVRLRPLHRVGSWRLPASHRQGRRRARFAAPQTSTSGGWGRGSRFSPLDLAWRRPLSRSRSVATASGVGEGRIGVSALRLWSLHGGPLLCRGVSVLCDTEGSTRGNGRATDPTKEATVAAVPAADGDVVSWRSA